MMGEFSYFAIAAISLLGAMSPGPDFFIVVRNSTTYSRKIGFITVLGICSALIIHLTYTLAGIAVLLVESPILYSLITYFGAGWVQLNVWGLESHIEKHLSSILKQG